MEQLKKFRQQWENDYPDIQAHTSGSTGTPKDILLSKEDMKVSARATCKYFGITDKSVLGLPLSLDYIAGKMMAVRSFVSGAELLMMPVSNYVVVDRHIDLLAVVPSQVPSLLVRPEASQLVRNLLIGGSPLPQALERQLAHNGWNAYVGYGMTETCSHVALRKVGEVQPIYHAMPGITFSTDSNDCLRIHSQEYSWRTLGTRDCVHLHSPVEMEWVGRADNVIISGGRKFYPEELEKLYAPMLPGRIFIVTSVPDEKWGQAITVVVEGELPSPLPELPWCKKITAVARLPRTSTGKLIHRLPGT